MFPLVVKTQLTHNWRKGYLWWKKTFWNLFWIFIKIKLNYYYPYYYWKTSTQRGLNHLVLFANPRDVSSHGYFIMSYRWNSQARRESWRNVLDRQTHPPPIFARFLTYGQFCLKRLVYLNLWQDRISMFSERRHQFMRCSSSFARLMNDRLANYAFRQVSVSPPAVQGS